MFDASGGACVYECMGNFVCVSECNPNSGILHCRDALPSTEQSMPQVDRQVEHPRVVSTRRLTNFDFTNIPQCSLGRQAPDPTENCSDAGYGGKFYLTWTDDVFYDYVCRQYNTDICYDEEVDIYLDYLPQTSDSPSEAPAARATASTLLPVAAAAKPTSKAGTDPPAEAMAKADPLIRGGPAGQSPPRCGTVQLCGTSPEQPTSDQLLIEMEMGAGTGILGDAEEDSRSTAAPEPSGALPSPGVALMLILTLPAMVLE